jgi:sterol desaturase/sphingolipid hydroxylase (fatty acid hydroxylase superfamily)
MEILRDVVSSLMMLPVFGLIFVLLERIVPERRGKLWRKETLVDIGFYAMGPVVIHTARLFTDSLSGALTGPLLPKAFDRFAHGVGFASQLPLWVQILCVALIHDFVGYWGHRWMHTEALWPMHSVHHTSARVNWASLFRLHPFDTIFLHVSRTLPLLLLGFSAASIGIYGAFFGIWGMVVHANVRLRLGPLRYILVTPIHHHRHHALLAEGDRGKNYAAVFSFWDRFFGTLDPLQKFPDAYGLNPQPVESVGGLLVGPFAMWRGALRQRSRRGAREC